MEPCPYCHTTRRGHHLLLCPAYEGHDGWVTRRGIPPAFCRWCAGHQYLYDNAWVVCLVCDMPEVFPRWSGTDNEQGEP